MPFKLKPMKKRAASLEAFIIPPVVKIPIVAFNEQGNQINPIRQLPAEALYLLTPADSEMIFDGESRQIEELIPLVGAWKDWKIDYLDLSQAWSLMLARNGQPLGDVIPIQGVIAQPELTGGHLFQFQDQDDPLYTAELPNLSVPLASVKIKKFVYLPGMYVYTHYGKRIRK
jgi:hypothetical protein